MYYDNDQYDDDEIYDSLYRDEEDNSSEGGGFAGILCILFICGGLFGYVQTKKSVGAITGTGTTSGVSQPPTTSGVSPPVDVSKPPVIAALPPVVQPPQSQPPPDNYATYTQAVAAQMGIKNIPDIRWGCEMAGTAGTYYASISPTGDLTGSYICVKRDMSEHETQFTIAHELGHHLDREKGTSTPGPSNEQLADRHAVDALMKLNKRDAVNVKASATPFGDGKGYDEGIEYARRALGQQ